jgi:hypothetical protein
MSFIEDTNQIFILHGKNVSNRWKVLLKQNIKVSNCEEKLCRDPSFGLATKARVCKGAS